MNFQTAKQQMNEANRQISYKWSKLREIWQDKNADEFYKTYVQHLERQMKASLEAIDEIDELFKDIQKDCFK